MSLSSEICFRLSRRRVLSRKTGDAGENAATFDPVAYRAWRSQELRSQFEGHFGKVDVQGLDILDLGCGEGDLSFMLAERGAKSIVGIDAIADRIASGQKRLAETPSAKNVDFRLADDVKRIALPDASVDLIVCFDVLEHIMDYESVIAEWARVLRPGGRVFIWWVPWFHPWGPHIESLVPIPWAHVFFSDKALLETCARVYDMPEFRPRLWDLDANGKKKPNKWKSMTVLPDVNRLTIGRFEAILRKVGLSIEEKRARGFSSSALLKFSSVFTRLPGFREFFTAFLTYKLRK